MGLKHSDEYENESCQFNTNILNTISKSELLKDKLIRKGNNIVYFPCELCQFTTRDKLSFLVHSFFDHGKFLYESNDCPHCCDRFHSRSGFLRHLQTAHIGLVEFANTKAIRLIKRIVKH